MGVDRKDPVGKSEYMSKIYYFCSLGHKKAFDTEPNNYINIDHSGHSSRQQKVYLLNRFMLIPANFLIYLLSAGNYEERFQ